MKYLLIMVCAAAAAAAVVARWGDDPHYVGDPFESDFLDQMPRPLRR